MMKRPQRGPARPDLAGAVVKFALLDLVGMLLLALGIAYLVQGPGALFDAFPGTTTEAVVVTAAGAVFMAYAAVGILRAVAGRQDRSEE